MIIKGILDAEDGPRSAFRFGADGIVVSQSMVAPARWGSLFQHPRSWSPIADAVQGRSRFWFDSGIRTGLDIVRMMALGRPTSPLLGRPFIYAWLPPAKAASANLLNLNRKGNGKSPMVLHGGKSGLQTSMKELLVRTAREQGGRMWRK